MPWVDEELCTGCGLCVEECPVDTIVMKDHVAEIDMNDCIRCGSCHGICPTEAVKHDRMKIPDEVAEGYIGYPVFNVGNCIGNRQGIEISRTTLNIIKKMPIAALQGKTIRQRVNVFDQPD